MSTPSAQTGDYLDTAVRIGRDIAEAAVWHEQRCNWVGAMPDEGPAGIRMTYTALGPDLYGGTAGIAFALAHLHSASGEAVFRSTALGAIEHALGKLDQIEPVVRLGVYAGQLGIAMAAAHVGTLLDEPRLLERANAVAVALDFAAEPVENDLLSGRAGAVVGLLVLDAILVDKRLLEQALTVGERLCELADSANGTQSWPSPSFPTQPNLTGLSHGAAGISTALLELTAVSGDARFQLAAEGGFAYERELYDTATRNWPDLREIATRGRPQGAPPSYAAFWCHGAPGIALSRMRAYELTGEDARHEEALAALQTTQAAVSAELHHGNYSLCHGLAGNAEILHEGQSLLGREGAELAHAAATAGIESYAQQAAPWPSGAFNGRTPSLFLGLAGTAYFYLRLHEPQIPSLLLLRPNQFRPDDERVEYPS
jgi:lantibiotic modifying enzyme